MKIEDDILQFSINGNHSGNLVGKLAARSVEDRCSLTAVSLPKGFFCLLAHAEFEALGGYDCHDCIMFDSREELKEWLVFKAAQIREQCNFYDNESARSMLTTFEDAYQQLSNGDQNENIIR